MINDSRRSCAAGAGAGVLPVQWLVCTENNQLTGNIQCPEYYSCYCCISHHHHLRDTNNIIITVVCLNNKYYINHIPVAVK